MILRVGHATATNQAAPEAAAPEAWPAFAKTQQSDPGSGRADNFAGCITQPAHAALAAQLAKALNPDVFGPLPSEVIDAIGRHDAGWAEPDLAALECVGEKQPESFLTYPPEGAVKSWRKSIREAELRSALAGILTSRHFCLLAPRDSDPHHTAFVEDENQRRAQHETDSPSSREDLDRFTAALGFCDLLSLCLCSGLTGTVQIPLVHPADPASHRASKVTISLATQTFRLDQQVLAPETIVHVDGWVPFAPNVLGSQRFHWAVA